MQNGQLMHPFCPKREGGAPFGIKEPWELLLEQKQ
jgi:hypothetical protein